MSQMWLLLSPLSGREALSLSILCNEAIETYMVEHPDCDNPCEIGPGGPLATREDVVEAHRRYRLALPDSIIDKLAACRSSIMIDRPRGGRTSDGQYVEIPSLQISILRFLLRRVGDGLALFNDYPLVSSRIVLLDLRQHDGEVDFPV